MKNNRILVRGGGDLASGVIHRLYRCGYRVLILESEAPSAIRREVSFCEAVYEGEAFVEGILCRKISSTAECEKVWQEGEIPLLADEKGACIKKFAPDVVIDAILAKRNLGTTKEMAPLTIALGPGFAAGYDVDFVVETMRGHDLGKIIEDGEALPNTGTPGLIAGCIKEFAPDAVIDAILAKRNLGTTKEMAPLTIALGPGFAAGYDVDFVVETMRGHDLGKIIEDGEALPNTGTPGLIAGVGRERVIHSPAEGVILNKMKIADFVEKGQVIATVGDVPVLASLTGILRGIIRDGYKVHKGMKIADIDPRKEEKENCYTISDKARCIAGSVVEILLSRGVLPL